MDSCLKIMGAFTIESDLHDTSDSDEGDSDDIKRLFIDCQSLNETVVNRDEYILHITASNDSNPNIAVGLTDNSCAVYSLSNCELAKIVHLSEHKDKIINCRFSSRDSNLLYTGSSDGTIKLWDIRTPKKCTQTFLDTSVEESERNKTFNCFDVSSNDRLLSAGTDVHNGDAFILFWDIRNYKLLGGYWDSHTDDITQVRFHPEDTNKLISGSTDGLINVYDLSQNCEDDALVDSLNTESSIEQLLWYKENDKECISCITHVADVQLWEIDGARSFKYLTRAELAQAIRRKTEDYIYIASHEAKSSLIVLVGSNYRDGECIRGLRIKKTEVQPYVGFAENKQRVRSSWYNENTKIFLTGGEMGILNVWKVNGQSGNNF